MPWLSRNNFTPTDKLHADDLNNLANDDRTWGGNVNGGGYTLSNVVLVGAAGTAAGGVSSVFGRTGAVVAQAGDYTAAMVGAVPTSRQVIAGSGMDPASGGALTADVTLRALVTSVFGRTGAVALTPADVTGAGGVPATRSILTDSTLSGGGNLTVDRTLSVVADQTNQRVQVMSGGSAVGSPRHAINFINGANVNVAVADNAGANRVDITVSSTGGGSGMVDPTTTLGDLIVRGPSITGRLGVGSNGLVLTADSTQPLGMRWGAVAGVSVSSVFGRTGDVIAKAGDYTAAQVTNAVDYTVLYTNPPWIVNLPWAKITNTPDFLINQLTTKGDLPVQTATGQTRLPVGADGTTLIADSSQGVGMRWGQITTVNTVFGRNGTVVAQSGDYTVAQITNAVANTRAINTGTGLTGGGNFTIDRTLSVLPDTTNQQVQVMDTGALAGTRHAINFISGANVALSISDDSANNRVNVSIASTGGAGGLVDPTIAVGDLIVRGASAVQRLPVGFNGQVLTVDSTQTLGVRWGSAGGIGSQTPWTSDIDAANHSLGNVKGIGVNKAAASATARLDVLASGTEDGLRIVNTTATARASLTLANDGGSSLLLATYGSAYTIDPGLTGLEASAALKFVVQGAEAMRLNTGGHVLIGTPTDNGTNLLQVNGTIKSLSGGYVFPDGTTQATAAVSAVASVFGRTGAVVAQAGDYTAAQVTGAVSTSGSYADPAWITSLAWSKITGAPGGVVSVFGRTGAVTATSGDYNAAQITNAVSTLGSYADPPWITALNWSKVTGAPAIVGQTPWLQDIDGAGFTLKNVGKIGVGTTSPQARLEVIQAATLSVPALGAATGAIHIAGTASSVNDQVMALTFGGISTGLDYSNVGAAGIYVQSSAVYGTKIYLATCNSFAAGSQVRATVDQVGNVGIGTTTPGSKLHVTQTAVGGLGPVITLENSNGNLHDAASIKFVDSNLRSELRFSVDNSPYGGDLIYYSGASGTTEVFRIRTDGNVGIGTTNPGAKLDIVSAASIDGIKYTGLDRASLWMYVSNGTNLNWLIQTNVSSTGDFQLLNATAAGATPNVARLCVTGAGNVGIGTASPGATLEVVDLQANNTPGSGHKLRLSYGGTGLFGYRVDAANNCLILDAQWSAWTAVMSWDRSSGRVGIGNVAPGYKLDVSGDCNISGTYRVNGTPIATGGVGVYINGVNQGTAPAIDCMAGAGMQCTLGGGPAGTIRVVFTATSDMQLKRNIQPLTDGGLSIIDRLRPITAEWNGLANTREGERMISVIAQDLRAVIPDAVKPFRAKLRPEDEEDTEILSVDSMAITAHLILAVQELGRRLKALEQRIN